MSSNFLCKVLGTQYVGTDRRLVKILGLGKDDVQTINQVSPHGVDSNPVKDMIGVYAYTLIMGESTCLGYLNRNMVADVGEMRTFSTDENGNVKFYIWQKNDGTCLIGGDADNMVRYSKLEQAYNQLKADHDALVDDINTLKQAFANWTVAPNDGGAALKSVSGSWFIQSLNHSTGDITPAKINEIKTI